MRDDEFPDGINYAALQFLATQPHPNIRDVMLPPGTHVGVDEVLTQAKVTHHLLTLAGVPNRSDGTSSGDLDARMFLALRRIQRQQEILDRIAARHARETGPGGTVGDFCLDCGQVSPCETFLLATGQLDENEAEDV